jgi:hypothetical protein
MANKKYDITGLMKRKYRGAGLNTVTQVVITAESAEKAAAKFGKEYPKYEITQVVEKASSEQESKEKTHSQKEEKDARQPE